MAELATIARPYAEALFDLSRADLQGAQSWLDGLAAAAASKDLLQLAANPRVQADQVYDLVAGLLGDKLPTAGQNFLRTVIENGRLPALPEMARQFRVLANEVGGTADAVIQSALPIDEAELARLMQVLERRFDRKLQASVEIVPDLIGGVRVSVGDEVLDTSVKAQLEQMQAALAA